MSNYKELRTDNNSLQENLQKIKSTHLLYQLLNTYDIGFIVSDESGSIVYCNSLLLKLFNIRYEDIHSKNILRFLEFLEQNTISENSNITPLKQLYTNTEETYNAILNCKTNRFVKFSSYPLTGFKDLHRLWAFADITDKINGGITLKVDNQTIDSLKSIYEGKINELLDENKILSKEREELSRDTHTKEIFISVIAHDLKSPFQGLLGIFDIISESLDEISTEEIKKYLSYAKTSVKNLYVLIEELLEWSRLYLRQVQFEPVKCNLTLELSSVIDLYKSMIDNKKITVINYLKDKIEVYADENMLNSILRNLISNAVKYSNRGGSIIIKSKKQNGYIELSVTDQGVGISSEAQEKLFKIDKFFSTRGTENEEGSGLGLLLCKEMISLHGGEIWFETELGKGSTFYITLPLNKEK